MAAAFGLNNCRRMYTSGSPLSGTFFEKIGSPKFICAPMVSQSYLPFRMLVRSNGADLAFTQMMHAKLFATVDKYRQMHSDWHLQRSEEEKVLGKPLIVQLAGSDPAMLVHAAKRVQHQVSAVDVNLGCPQDIARRGNYGAYLLPKRKLLQQVFSTMVRELECPVTAKIRIQDNLQDTFELVQMLSDCGIAMLTVHGRTISQNKQYCGPCNWDAIRQVKQFLLDKGSHLPVIANGGVDGYDAAQRCLKETLCDGVMSSEGILENPKLFSEEGDREFRTNYARSQLITLNQFLTLAEQYACLGDPKIDQGSVKMHLFKLLYRYLLAPRNKDLLLELANTKEATYQQMRQLGEKIEARMDQIDYDTERGVREGYLSEGTWYQRHQKNSTSEQVSGE